MDLVRLSVSRTILSLAIPDFGKKAGGVGLIGYCDYLMLCDSSFTMRN